MRKLCTCKKCQHDSLFGLAVVCRWWLHCFLCFFLLFFFRYVNVMVRNSVQVVSHELERLAKKRWEDANSQSNAGNRFERFRAIAHGNLGMSFVVVELELWRILVWDCRLTNHVSWLLLLFLLITVKLAGLALASDFTPRRIAVQLSNDLYR